MANLLGKLAGLDTSSLLALVVNAGAIALVLLGMYKHFVISKGASQLRKFYWLNIAMGVISFTMNTFLVIRDPQVWGILSLQVVVVWSIVMAVKGLLYGDTSVPRSDS